MKGSTLKQDPTAGIQNFKDGESTTTIYVRGCCGSRTPLIHPDNRMLMKWIMLGIFFVLYEVFLTPYRMCFNAPAKGVFFGWEVIVNIFFILDLLANFFVAFRNAEAELVMDHGAIIKKYLRGWFMVDFPASIPVDWIVMLLTKFVLTPSYIGLFLTSNVFLTFC